MTQDEFNELERAVQAVAVQDVHLGRVLFAMLTHLGALAGVSTAPAVEVPTPVEVQSA